MPLKKQEKDVIKAVKGMLSHDLLGLSMHNKDESSHHSQFRWSGISDAFRLKALNSPFVDPMCAAFAKTHGYKYLDHPTFKLAMEVDMKSMGLPTEAIQEAHKIVDELTSELKTKHSERDVGWPDMKAMQDVTSCAHNREMKHEEPFTGGGPAPKK